MRYWKLTNKQKTFLFVFINFVIGQNNAHVVSIMLNGEAKALFQIRDEIRPALCCHSLHRVCAYGSNNILKPILI